MPGRFPTAEQIRAAQVISLNDLLRELVPGNRFYSAKISEAGVSTSYSSFEEFQRSFPFTTKQEIARDQETHPR
jgi:phenylacetate-coenzyme A ligase PaaK-like adenylate-forming protein